MESFGRTGRKSLRLTVFWLFCPRESGFFAAQSTAAAAAKFPAAVPSGGETESPEDRESRFPTGRRSLPGTAVRRPVVHTGTGFPADSGILPLSTRAGADRTARRVVRAALREDE